MVTARRIAIVGAGLGGLAAAIALRRQGFEVQVYEQAPELAEFGAGINISPNSVKFFHAVGLADKLHAIGSEPIGLTWRDWNSGEIHNCLPFVDFEKRYGAKYYVVHRSDLHRLLSETVPQESIQLGKRCTAVESRNGTVGLSFDGRHQRRSRRGRRLRRHPLGGPRLRVRRRRPALRGNDVLARAGAHRCAAEGLSRPPCEPVVRRRRFRHQLLRSARQVHQFRRVRQQPGWTEQSWSVPSNVEEMLAAFPHAGENLRRMMGAATSCSKWGQFTGEHAPQWTKDRVTLLGDSAHAMLATFGQGANMAFEDAYVLAQWLRASADDPHAALTGYEAARKPRATRVQQLSRTEVRFKKQHSNWERIRREAAFMTRHGATTTRGLSLDLRLRSDGPMARHLGADRRRPASVDRVAAGMPSTLATSTREARCLSMEAANSAADPGTTVCPVAVSRGVDRRVG